MTYSNTAKTENVGPMKGEVLAQDHGDHPLDRGLRPSFNALWHLNVLGVSDNSTGGDGAKIVVMDTPVDTDHPNLLEAIDLVRMRDFSIFNEGVFVKPHDKIEGIDQKDVQRIRRELTSEIDDDAETVARKMRLARNVPGAHGTAVAGLIGARDATIALRTAAHNKDDGTFEASELNETFQVPYRGINPKCQIIPVTLTAAPYPEMVQGALDYILKLQPDIVVIAAAWAEQADLERDCKKWVVVARKLIEISQKSIVLCAAGNQNLTDLVFPASLINKQEPHNIWAVCACDEAGNELTYSPKIDPSKRMIKTLSTEYPVFTRNKILRDIWGAPDPDLNEADKIQEENAVFPAKDIISLDPLGQQGYNPSPYRERRRKRKKPTGDAAEIKQKEDARKRMKIGQDLPFLEIGSMFSRFSGSSAAVAISAGLISRVIEPGDDHQAKAPHAEQAKLFTLDIAKQIFGET